MAFAWPLLQANLRCKCSLHAVARVCCSFLKSNHLQPRVPLFSERFYLQPGCTKVLKKPFRVLRIGGFRNTVRAADVRPERHCLHVEFLMCVHVGWQVTFDSSCITVDVRTCTVVEYVYRQPRTPPPHTHTPSGALRYVYCCFLKKDRGTHGPY